MGEIAGVTADGVLLDGREEPVPAVAADGRDAEARLGLALALFEFLPRNPSPLIRAHIVAELVAVRRLDPALAETNRVDERLQSLGAR